MRGGGAEPHGLGFDLSIFVELKNIRTYHISPEYNEGEEGEKMNNDMLLQLMHSFLPPENREVLHAFQEAMDLQQLILSYAARGGENWQQEMLEAVRARLPERNRHMVDVLIKCMELSALLKKGGIHDGY